MKTTPFATLLAAGALAVLAAVHLMAQAPGNQGRPANNQPGGPPDFDGPPPFDGNGPPPGFGGFGGPPPGMGGEERKLVKEFDKDGDKRLNAAERKAARESLKQDGQQRRGRFGPPGGMNRGIAGKPGRKISPAEVTNYPNATLYDPSTFRTFFLEFEDSDWEQELADFKNTDVEVPANLTVDGKKYPDVGVKFHGMSSFMMVGAGSKRSLHISLDFAHKDQQIGGYRNIELLNSHEDPSFLRTVLSYQIEREYVPAPKANFAKVAINGESWGVYINVQTFSKEFGKDWFQTTKGARWKVPGSPNGQGSLAYLGEDAASYKKVYEIKSKDDDKSWADLIKLCKVLNETPADKLVAALDPILDIDGALKFLALENVLINNDGYWVRTSDYTLYQDTKGKFHVIPRDSNETFLQPHIMGGPGGPGGRGGRGRMGGFGGPGGPGGPRMPDGERGQFARGGPSGPMQNDLGLGGLVAMGMVFEGDADKDGKLNRSEISTLADQWFEALDKEAPGKVDLERFTPKFSELLTKAFLKGLQNQGSVMLSSPELFSALDQDKNGKLEGAEMKSSFVEWHKRWAKDGFADTESLRQGLNSLIDRRAGSGIKSSGVAGGTAGAAGFGGRGGFGGPGGMWPGGPGGGSQIKGVELDPLFAAKDARKPLISKLLAVPELRAKYLGYTRDIAEKWLDWSKLGPIAQKYHDLIAEEVKLDNRKLESTEEFESSLTGVSAGNDGRRSTISLKAFADQRRAYLLNYKETAAGVK